MAEQLEELECQNHANCGDYCNTPREREMVLCEGCLDSYDQQQADQEELRTLRELRAGLSDPEAVLVGMLRGDIAKLSPRGIAKVFGEVLNGEDAQQVEIARLRAELTERDTLLREIADHCKGCLMPTEELLEDWGNSIDAMLSGKPSKGTWPKERDVGRYGDMSQSAHLRVGLDGDSDVYVSVYDEEGGASVEFCTQMAGGGKSPKTREALIALMIAMEEDSAAHPAFDWWGARNVAEPAKGGDGEGSHE